METIKVTYELPPVLPHGWKKCVAIALGVHINTITNNLREGKGETYDRIMQTARIKYGRAVKTQKV